MSAPYEAQFRHGEPEMVDYTPSGGNVAAGEVVILGNTTGLTCGIAHLPIVNGEKGSLGVGNGIYHVKAASNYAAWTKVYWDNSANAVTTTSTNNAQFGYTIEAAAAANAYVEALHSPRA